MTVEEMFQLLINEIKEIKTGQAKLEDNQLKLEAKVDGAIADIGKLETKVDGAIADIGKLEAKVDGAIADIGKLEAKVDGAIADIGKLELASLAS
ncbi:MAG: hypothetical protein IPK14_14800 [Blastocatellia bacterium]|nr:hypothetical protein [Blastocatellia bacterium]